MKPKFLRRASNEETVDVQTAVRLLITRLQETGQAAGIDPNQISSSQLSDLMATLKKPESLSAPSKILAPYRDATQPKAAGLEITLTTRQSREKNEPILLTPTLLSRSLAQYLNAIITVQNVFNEVKDLPLRKIPVLEIRSQPNLVVRLDGEASEAIYVIKGIVNTWRQRNAQQLSRASTGDLQNHIEKSTLDRSKVEMASQMLDLVKAGMTEKEKFTYLSALIPSLDVLIFSEYEMS